MPKHRQRPRPRPVDETTPRNLDIQFGLSEEGTVVLQFPVKVQWMAFPPDQAIAIANKIIEYALLAKRRQQ